MTDKPISFETANLWGLYGRQKKSFLISTALQSVAVALMFLALSSSTVQQQVKHVTALVMPVDLAPAALPKPQSNRGGGGGGDRSPLSASKGRLPKASVRQFTPPSAVINDPNPKLAIEPTILAPPDVKLPNVNIGQYGDPLAKIGPLSNGTGSGGGIGSGKGGGVGAGFGGGVYRVGDRGLVLPIALYEPGPEYSDDARRARLSGEVLVRLIIDETGHTRDAKVIHSLGLGLDEEALKAVAKWLFRPASKDGKPVAVVGEVHLGFHLL